MSKWHLTLQTLDAGKYGNISTSSQSCGSSFIAIHVNNCGSSLFQKFAYRHQCSVSVQQPMNTAAEKFLGYIWWWLKVTANDGKHWQQFAPKLALSLQSQSLSKGTYLCRLKSCMKAYVWNCYTWCWHLYLPSSCYTRPQILWLVRRHWRKSQDQM